MNGAKTIKEIEMWLREKLVEIVEEEHEENMAGKLIHKTRVNLIKFIEENIREIIYNN